MAYHKNKRLTPCFHCYSFLITNASTKQAFHTSPPAKLAKVTLIGRLGATPQVAKDKQGRDILIYSVATNEKVAPKEDGSEFHG